MNSVSFYLLLLIPLTAIAMSTTISATTIGVTYSTPASVPGSAQLSPDRIAANFVSMKIPAVRLLDSNPAMIRAFANTNVSLLLSIPNTLVPILALNRSLAMHWVHLHVLPFHLRTKISTISVGNDMISYSPDLSPLFLLGAMQNVHLSLADLRIYGISVSTTFSFFDIIIPQFQQQSTDVIIMWILRFLEKTNSSLLISLCPHNMFRSSCSIPVGFGRLFENLPLNFRATGGKFRELFDMMVDVVISSMAVTGHENLPVIVAETGWPRPGIDASEVDARWLYSEMLLKALIANLSYGRPLRKESVSVVYMYELVEKDHANLGIRNWGLVHHMLAYSCMGLCIVVVSEITRHVIRKVIELRGLVIEVRQLRRRAQALMLRLEEMDKTIEEILRQWEEVLAALIPFREDVEIHRENVKQMRKTGGPVRIMLRIERERTGVTRQVIKLLIRERVMIAEIREMIREEETRMENVERSAEESLRDSQLGLTQAEELRDGVKVEIRLREAAVNRGRLF